MKHLKRLAVLSAVLTAATALVGCQPHGSDGGRAERAASVDYDKWEPAYRNVRPLTSADLAEFRDRVQGLNASGYTATLESLGAVIAHAPEHIRVRFGEGDSGEFDLHLEPQPSGISEVEPYVVCFASEDACVEVGEGASSGEAPHLFNNMVDSAIAMLAGIVQAQLKSVDGLSVSGTSYATVESPLGGDLDCVVGGGTPADHANLEGRPVELSPNPIIAKGDAPPLFPFCIDQHGLVVVFPSLLTPFAPYSSFEPGVAADIDRYSTPVRYGETPTPTPSSSATEPPDPNEPQQVLVAAGVINAGESLENAMAAGKLSLDSLPAGSVLPGALTSVTGLEDRVALVEVPVGGQITEEIFGTPGLADLRARGVTQELYDAVQRIAVRSGYVNSPGTAPGKRQMLVLAYRFAHRCEAVTSGTTTWQMAAIDDTSGATPTYDQALELNEYLEASWCRALSR